jgi:hypothetical protein
MLALCPEHPAASPRIHEIQVRRHRLPPLLGKAFGGSTAPVYVEVGGRP